MTSSLSGPKKRWRAGGEAAACPGAREARWSHLLCGAIDVSSLPVAAQSEDFVAASELAALKSQQVSMRRELDELRTLVDTLYAELGVSRT